MPEAEAPVVWGDYEVRLDRLLGRGGMGSVYEARQVSLDRTVAVKVLDTERAPTEDLAEGFLGKFQHEARALAKLNDPRIVTILQAGRADGKCWYAMELVEGMTVDQRLSDAGAFPPPEAARVAAEVARALAAALAQGIIHRDVKPANIFLTTDGRVKLGDFGLARSGAFKPTRFTEMNAVAGTPEYASPEQAANGACDHRSDQYSLGVVLFEMVTERPPFGGANALETFFQHAHEPPPAPSRLNPEIPPALEAIILRCLEKDPERRYPNYDALILELEAVRVAPVVAAPEPPRPPERPTLAIRTALVAGVVLLGFSIWGASRLFSPGPTIPPKPAPVAIEPPPPPPPAPVKETPIEAPPPPPPPAAPLLTSDDAWKACDRGDAETLTAYLATARDAALEEELAGLREPFSHPRTKAYERAVAALYAGRNHEPEPLGEPRAWKGYPDATKGKWTSTSTGLQIRDRDDATWLARDLAVGRGYTVKLRFAPGGAGSWAGVAISPMSEKSYRMLHVVETGEKRVASILDWLEVRAEGRGEIPVAAAESHEFAIVERGGKFACFIDGVFVGWETGPGPGGRLYVGVHRGEIEVTEIRRAR